MNYVKIFSVEHVSSKNQRSSKFCETYFQENAVVSEWRMSNFPLSEGVGDNKEFCL